MAKRAKPMLLLRDVRAKRGHWHFAETAHFVFGMVWVDDWRWRVWRADLQGQGPGTNFFLFTTDSRNTSITSALKDSLKVAGIPNSGQASPLEHNGVVVLKMFGYRHCG